VVRAANGGEPALAVAAAAARLPPRSARVAAKATTTLRPRDPIMLILPPPIVSSYDQLKDTPSERFTEVPDLNIFMNE
jgi:hypothetical protein